MSIAFVNPPLDQYRKIMRNFDCATESKAHYLYQPYDFLLMSARVPADCPFELIDAIADKATHEETLRKIIQCKPKIIVLAMANTSWNEDFQFLKILHQEVSQAKILVFGDLFFEEYFKQQVTPYVHSILTDPIFINFKTLLQDKEGFLEPPSLQHLKKPHPFQLGIPKHEKFVHAQYRWPFARHYKYTTVFTAWGCPYSCDYCIMSQFPNYWREAKEVLEELDVIKAQGFKEIYIGDRSFGLPYQNILALLDGMIEKDYQFSWSSYFHPNQYTPALLEKMKLSGCHTLVIGIESHDLHLLKKHGRHVTVENLEKLINHAERIGIDICGDFIIGLPGESRESILETIHYAKRLKLDYASFNIAAPLPGTSIRKKAIEVGSFSNAESSHYDSLGKHQVIGNGLLTGKEIQDLKKQAVKRFYLNPSFMWRRVRKLRGLQHLIIQASEGLKLLVKQS